jgi:predicted SprT family Zn-dependent metalloprotease
LIQLELPLAPPRRPRRAPSTRPPAALARLARVLGRRLARALGGGPLSCARVARRLRGLSVVWNRRLRTALGRADFARRAIELNPALLDRHPGELLPTLVHELCHLAAGARAAHGASWRAAMRALGAEPAACHRLEVADLAGRRRAWLWRCTRCGESYRRRRRDAHRYRCGRCRGGLAVEGPALA